MELKICRWCEEEKPLTEYPERSDGKYSWHAGQCRSCKNLANRYSYVKHREKNTIRDRRRYYENPERRAYNIRCAAQRAATPVGRAKARVRGLRWREMNPEKYKAQTAVGNAVRDGKLAKSSCACGESEGVVGHHDDYSQPLDVVWMCRQCHGLEHRKGLPGGGANQVTV